MDAVGVVGRESEGPGEKRAGLHHEEPIRIAPAAMDFIHRGTGGDREAQEAVFIGRCRRDGHDASGHPLGEQLEAPKVTGQEGDVVTGVAQRALGRAEEARK